MKIPASPLLIASLALTSSTLAAPTAIKRDNSPSPNPDQGGFEAPVARYVAEPRRRGNNDVRSPNPDLGNDRRRSVMLGQPKAGLKAHRRTVSLSESSVLPVTRIALIMVDGKRQLDQVTGAASNIVGTATGTVGALANGGNPLQTVGGIVGGVADTANGVIDGLPIAGPIVGGVTRPLTGGIVDGLNSGNPLGVVHGALGGAGGAVAGLTGTVSGLLPGQLGGLVGGITKPLTDGLQSGRPVTGVVNTANGLIGTVGGILPGGLGDTVTGITAPLLGTVGGTVDGLIGQNGPLGGVLGQNGLVEGLLGGVGGGVLGEQGLVGGLLGGGQSGLLGGVLGGGGQGGLLGGLLGGGGGNGGLLGGVLGGGGSGGLLGGLLGGNAGTASAATAATNPSQAQFAAAGVQSVAQAASANLPLSTLLGVIKQQGGVVQNLGNGQFLTKAGSVVTLPAAIASQLQGLLAQAQQQVGALTTAGSEGANAAVASGGPTPAAASVAGGAAGDQFAGLPVGGALGAVTGQLSNLGLPTDTIQSVASNLPVDTLRQTGLGSAFPFSAASDATSGKLPPSQAALDLAEQIKQKGQALSDGTITDTNLLATLQAAAASNPGINMMSLGDGMDNADLGPISGLMLGPNGEYLVPLASSSAAPPTQSAPAASSALTPPISSATSAIYSVQSAMASQAAASSLLASASVPLSAPSAIPTISLPNTDEHDGENNEYDSAQSEYGSDDESVYDGDDEVNADVFPNFYSGDNEVFNDAIDVANSVYDSTGQYRGASASMIPQNSAGLA